MEIIQRVLNDRDCTPEFEAAEALRRAPVNPVPGRRGIWRASSSACKFMLGKLAQPSLVRRLAT
ncbi:hypothetical protein [Variovorax sp. ZT5P30]|uniref:hypothetical protein n=1 Tax=Variovorax sp. ZT5P30 TaxID=3443735 RepID=UPI003F499835